MEPGDFACFYSFVALICGGLGAGVASTRNAAFWGFVLGLFFGPLGLLAAFRLDDRPQCPWCCGRLAGRGALCPHCRSEIVWFGKTPCSRKGYERMAREAKDRPPSVANRLGAAFGKVLGRRG